LIRRSKHQINSQLPVLTQLRVPSWIYSSNQPWEYKVMLERAWFITGISSGFGRLMTEQLLKRGDRVAGTARQLQAGISTALRAYSFAPL